MTSLYDGAFSAARERNERERSEIRERQRVRTPPPRDPFHFREALAMLVVLCLALACTRCQPRTPEQAEAAYTAEQTACVVDCHARREPISCVRACREASDRKWGVSP